MIIPTQYICDAPGCDSVRREANHWFVILNQGHIRIYTWENAETDHVLDCGKHFCGQTHALQFLSAEMGK